MAQAVHRKLFLTTLLSSSFIFCAQAYAQNGDTYFYPKNKWVVEQVGTDGELPICSISNQLNNGYIVQMAGTKNKLSNFNIDFRQSIFQKNMKYEVQYTVPGQGSTLVPTKAFKDSLLVSDLRENSEFADKLFDASTVDVNIRGNKFRIYLTGLKAGMTNYSACVDPDDLLANAEADIKLKEQVLATEPAQPQGAAPLPPVNYNDQKVAAQTPEELPKSKKRPDFESRERYSEELANKLKEESQQYKPQEPEIYNAADDAAGDVAQNKEEIAPKDQYEAAIDDVKKMVDRKDTIYHITKPSKPVVADLTTLDAPLQIKKEPAEEPVEVNAAEVISDYEPASGNTNEDFVIMRNKISNLEKQLETLMSKNKMLDEELRSALQDSQKESLSVSSQNWNLEKATMKFNEAERQILRLGRQLQTTRAECEQDKQNLESMLFDPKLTNQSQLTKLSSLEADLDETKSELYRQQRQYEERIKLLEQRLNAQ